MALRLDDVDLVRDRALVERFQAGDDQAFDELYRRYFRRLERFCARRVGEGSDAEEVAQEAFARAYAAMGKLGGERRFYPWVSVIAARLCVDTHRRRARSQPSDDIDLGTVDGGQEQVLQQVDIDLLRRALDNLGPRHREVLELREQQGWSYQRIAEHYDVTLGTVEALLFRARKALRREFLALAGPDGGRRGLLVGLPGMAFLARHLTNARARLDTIVQPGLAQVAAGGVAAVALGGVALVGGHALPSGPAAAPAAVTATPAVAAVTTQAAVSTAASTISVATAGVASESATPAEPSAAPTAPTTHAKVTTTTAPAAAPHATTETKGKAVAVVPVYGGGVTQGPAPVAQPKNAARVTITGDPVGYVAQTSGDVANTVDATTTISLPGAPK